VHSLDEQHLERRTASDQLFHPSLAELHLHRAQVGRQRRDFLARTNDNELVVARILHRGRSDSLRGIVAPRTRTLQPRNPADDANIHAVRAKVHTLTSRFPVYG
jgi:hypothetical protein